MTPDPISAVRSHRDTAHDGDPHVFADCCEQIALDAVRAALTAEAARLPELHAALSPWREDG